MAYSFSLVKETSKIIFILFLQSEGLHNVLEIRIMF